MANNYTTLADVKASFIESTDYSGTTDYDVIYNSLMATASRLIDREVGRWDGFFYPTTDAQTFTYDGSGGPSQEIDEFVSITSVQVSDSGGVASTSYDTWASTDYFVEPYNYSQKARPITKLTVDSLNGAETVFTHYPKSVKVTGIPGWSLTTPSEIGQACLIQVVRWFMRHKQAFMDTGAGVTIGTLNFKGQLQLDPDVKALLWPYKLELMPQ